MRRTDYRRNTVSMFIFFLLLPKPKQFMDDTTQVKGPGHGPQVNHDSILRQNNNSEIPKTC